MSNTYFNKTGSPAPNGPGSSSSIRAEFAAIETGFDRLPIPTGNGGKLVAINAGGSGMEAVSSVSGLAISASTLNGSPVGNLTPSTGAFTSLSASGGITGNVTGNVVGGVSGNVTATTGTSGFMNVAISGSLDMDAGTASTITGLAEPTGASDAATKNYVDSKVSALVNSAPAVLDTLAELSNALGGDANFAASTATSIGTKLPKSGGTMTGVIDMGGNKITNVGTPTVGTDSANVTYVLGQYAATVTAVSASATSASTSAAQANTAKDLAIAAWGSATAPNETLAALSQSLHIGTVVKAIVYDTSLDSDSGKWRKRCTDKSWYTEALGGDRWIGQQATIAAAWAAAGSVVGAVFQASATAGSITLGKYYSANSATTVTEVFRGVSREFPAVAGIVAESSRVVIYDLSTGAMWMVFIASSANWLFSTSLTSVAASGGSIIVGGSTGLSELNLISEMPNIRTASGVSRQKGNASQRNSGAGFTFISATGLIVNLAVNDVAITVLDNAPVDPATGLPVPTIAVATGGGVSVIKHDGAVSNSSSVLPYSIIRFDGTSNVYAGCLGYVLRVAPTMYQTTGWAATALFNNASQVPNPLIQSFTKMSTDVYSGGLGFTKIKENPATPAKAMLVNITNAYNSGWMPGDIKGSYLADSVAETITATELVTNGTFTTDASGWTVQSPLIATWSSGSAVLTGGDAAYQNFYQVIPTLVGRAYFISASHNATVFDVGSDLANTYLIRLGTAQYGYFTATTTTTFVRVRAGAGQTVTVDNISVKLAESDRSVKNTGLSINGTLTKTAVASGAGLVAYSGFSAANYLEQPYSANLDFGTGDFCVMGWVNLSSITLQTLCSRYGEGGFSLFTNGSGYVSYICAATLSGIATSALVNVGLNMVAMFRYSGVLYIYLNGTQIYSIANVANISGTAPVLLFGISHDQTKPLTTGSLALWRISATAPSADQIAHIYRTELPLFQPNSQCTIAGTSTAVTALAYDDTADLLHVGTSWGRTSFKDLVRVDSEATTTGALTSLSAQGGTILTGGTSAKVYVPAMLLRDELKRKDEAAKALGKVPVFFDFTATASQTAFVLPKGYTTKALYKNGTLMRETTTGVYWSRSHDGFAETCTLSVGASVSDWISVMATRN